MKTLIAYCSNHGCTETVAREIAQNIGENADICNLKENEPENINDYTQIIVGGSIHAGKIQKEIKNFCTNNMEILLKKDLGLFVCCMYKSETAQKQFDDAFPAQLREHAKATMIAGGQISFGKMNFLERTIIKKAAKIKDDTDTIDHEAITKFTKKIDRPFIMMMMFV